MHAHVYWLYNSLVPRVTLLFSHQFVHPHLYKIQTSLQESISSCVSQSVFVCERDGRKGLMETTWVRKTSQSVFVCERDGRKGVMESTCGEKEKRSPRIVGESAVDFNSSFSSSLLCWMDDFIPSLFATTIAAGQTSPIPRSTSTLSSWTVAKKKTGNFAPSGVY